jgi:hypothetical protein
MGHFGAFWGTRYGVVAGARRERAGG